MLLASKPVTNGFIKYMYAYRHFEAFLPFFGIMRSSKEDIFESFVRAWKHVEAIQLSWDHEGMIVQEARPV